jgi:hypothetical protein
MTEFYQARQGDTRSGCLARMSSVWAGPMAASQGDLLCADAGKCNVVRAGVSTRKTPSSLSSLDLKVIHFAVTRRPYLDWVIQQLRESRPFGLQPRYLFRATDGLYGTSARAFLDSCGIEEVRTAYRSPWQDPFVERLIGTLRRELLDRTLCVGHDRSPLVCTELLSLPFAEGCHSISV